MKVPNVDHPISIEPNLRRVVVRFNGQVIAETTHALTLREASYAPVQYVPRGDVAMKFLERSDHSTHCPYKGDASYYSLRVGERSQNNAVWSYETPFPAVYVIKDYVAFYPDKVDAIVESPR